MINCSTKSTVYFCATDALLPWFINISMCTRRNVLAAYYRIYGIAEDCCLKLFQSCFLKTFQTCSVTSYSDKMQE